MSPADVEKHFKPIFDQAKKLRVSFQKSKNRVERDNYSNHDTVSVTGPHQYTNENEFALSNAPSTLGTDYQTDNKEEGFLDRLPFVTVC